MSSRQPQVIHLEYVNDSGERVEGDFLYTLPSLRQRVAIGVEESKMRAGAAADELDDVIRALIVQIAYLKHTVQFPADLTFDDSVDPYLLSQLYEGALSIESTFLDKLAPKGNAG